jgi:uncharacterized protein GlcG (DUF336 family)
MDIRSTRHVTLRGARRIEAAILEAAAAEQLEISVAIVDGSGFEVSLARTDGAELQTAGIAVRKAGNEGSDHHLLAITLASGADNFVTVGGGHPILVDGECVGGVGVSGAAHRDASLAAEGAALLADTDA